MPEDQLEGDPLGWQMEAIDRKAVVESSIHVDMGQWVRVVGSGTRPEVLPAQKLRFRFGAWLDSVCVRLGVALSVGDDDRLVHKEPQTGTE